MASQQNTIEYILEQISEAGTVRARKMFGEYGIYCNEKIVALVCDDQFFLKPTNGGKKFLGTFVEECPYPGAKPWLLIPGEQWDDQEWFVELIKMTTAEVDLPKKKHSKIKIVKSD